MEKLTICYEFQFTLTVRKKNGKLYHNHHIMGIGLNFRLALWDVYHTLKKRQSEIIAIGSVQPRRIAFAFDSNSVSIKTSLTEHPPIMPDDYAKELDHLPKKN